MNTEPQSSKQCFLRRTQKRERTDMKYEMKLHSVPAHCREALEFRIRKNTVFLCIFPLFLLLSWSFS